MAQYSSKVDYSGKPLEPKISASGRMPRSDSELPTQIQVGVDNHGEPIYQEVKLFEMPQPVITAFTRSQIGRMTPEEYAANQDAIILANQLNLVVDDVTDAKLLDEMDAAYTKSGARLLLHVELKDANREVDRVYDELNAARQAYEKAKVEGDDYDRVGSQQRVYDLEKVFGAANDRLRLAKLAVEADTLESRSQTAPQKQEGGDQQA